jgi:hypothetical protein
MKCDKLEMIFFMKNVDNETPREREEKECSSR